MPVDAENTSSAGVWIETPLIHSSHISDRLGCSAYLKLEVRTTVQFWIPESCEPYLSSNLDIPAQNLQPSQSFKYRGISLRLQESKAQRGPALHGFIASSGNAGLAAAVAARTLGVKCTVYLPVVVATDTQDMLRKQGANVVLVGQIYSDALKAMYRAAKEDPNALVVHPLL